MRTGLVIALTISLLAGCLGPEADRLEFFEVNLQQVSNTPELGGVELTGVLADDENIAIEEHGFIWASTVSALENLTAEAQWIKQPGAPESPAFTATATGLSLDSIYYFRAYAIAGERRALSDILSFSIGVNIGISREVFTDNDSAVLTGFIQGLQQDVNISVGDHGFVWSETNAFPEYGVDSIISIGQLNDDGLFSAPARNLAFNRLYYARAFVKPQDRPPYYSDTLSFRMGDGWKEGRSLLLPLVYASSTSINDKGYVVFGCFEEPCVEPSNRTNKFWEYNPEQDAWNEKAPFDGDFPTRFNATAFAIRDTLYVGFGSDPVIGGSQNFLRHFWWIAPNGSNTWMELENQPPGSMPRREGAFAFVIDNKAYLGGGVNQDSIALDDFWRYDPDGGAWEPMARLRSNNPNQNAQGRYGAVAFAINGKGYVGAGAVDAGSLFQDLWEFTPPATPQDKDTGSWQFHSNIPGRKRLDAIGFANDEKGYIGGGQLFNNSFYLEDFWEFDPRQDGDAAWASVSRLRDGGRARAFSFVIGKKGYIGGGETRMLDDNNFFFSIYRKTFWAYTPRQ